MIYDPLDVCVCVYICMEDYVTIVILAYLTHSASMQTFLSHHCPLIPAELRSSVCVGVIVLLRLQ